MRKHEIARITTMLLFVMLSTLTAFAQNITVKGVISDGQTNEPLMGVTVREKGNKTNGAVSDLDGNYSISVKSNATLVFSYMGFKDEEVAVQGRRSIAVTMHSESKVLDELVVMATVCSARAISLVLSHQWQEKTLTKPQYHRPCRRCKDVLRV